VADLIYSFDAVGETSYLYIVAFIQVLVGPSPYGVHLVAVIFYLTAAVMLYRLVRATLGRMPALMGLGLLLYLPSLFAWSISALKEPFFFLLTVGDDPAGRQNVPVAAMGESRGCARGRHRADPRD